MIKSTVESIVRKLSAEFTIEDVMNQVGDRFTRAQVSKAIRSITNVRVVAAGTYKQKGRKV